MRTILYAPAKINLHLEVGKKRKDGFHNLCTVFLKLALCDVIVAEIVPEPGCFIKMRGTGLRGEVIDEEENLITRAYNLFAKENSTAFGIRLDITKHIPIRAGMGGGSSDAATVLSFLARMSQLKSRDKLLEMGLKLGSDVPFFQHNTICAIAEGRGEKVVPQPNPFTGYRIGIWVPPWKISTGQAFQNFNKEVKGLTFPVSSIKAALAAGVYGARTNLFNDFYPQLIKEHPEYKRAEAECYKNGALLVALTGTGSALFSIFDKGSRPITPPSRKAKGKEGLWIMTEPAKGQEPLISQFQTAKR